MKDHHFIAMLTQKHLFPGTLKEEVIQSATSAEAASLFLYKAVERPLSVGHMEPFDKLLLVMEKFEDLTLNKLAEVIKQKLGDIHHGGNPG